MAARDVLAAVLGVVAAAQFTTSLALWQRANLDAMREAAVSGLAGRAGAVVRRGPWLAGVVFQVSGFATQSVAVGVGSLAAVQVALVTSIVFMVPAGAWVVRGRSPRRDWEAALVVLAGLAALQALARPGSGRDSAPWADWWLPLLLVTLPFAVLWLVAERLPDYRAALRGAAAGWEGGVVVAVSKQVIDNLGGGPEAVFSDWSIWGLTLLGPLNVLFVNAALRSGRLSAAMATITVSGPIASLFLAVTVFEERLSGGPLALAGASVATIVCAAGIAALARSESLLALDAAAQAESVADHRSAEE